MFNKHMVPKDPSWADCIIAYQPSLGILSLAGLRLIGDVEYELEVGQVAFKREIPGAQLRNHGVRGPERDVVLGLRRLQFQRKPFQDAAKVVFGLLLQFSGPFRWRQ